MIQGMLMETVPPSKPPGAWATSGKNNCQIYSFFPQKDGFKTLSSPFPDPRFSFLQGGIKKRLIGIHESREKILKNYQKDLKKGNQWCRRGDRFCAFLVAFSRNSEAYHHKSVHAGTRNLRRKEGYYIQDQPLGLKRMAVQ
jgi:hypothetical protein